MNELQHDSPLSQTLENAADTHIYHFEIQAEQTITVTFAAPPFEYTLLSDGQIPKGRMVVDYGIIPKGRMVVDYDVPKGSSAAQPLTLTQTMTFVGGSEAQDIYIVVGSVNDSSLPSAGYTINMSVE